MSVRLSACERAYVEPKVRARDCLSRDREFGEEGKIAVCGATKYIIPVPKLVRTAGRSSLVRGCWPGAVNQSMTLRR